MTSINHLAPPTGNLAYNVVGFARALRAAGLPVGPGAFIDASSNVVAESINAPESAARTIPLTDHPSETTARTNKIAKAWRD